ncbi:MAG: hypothetical protein HYX86_01205 [Chloroflexi bacterium]|nr:hypothetical protein [Chloroflexota bacterium]
MEFPEQISIGITFFYFAYLGNLGLLQIIAASHRRPQLSPCGGLRPIWGYTVGAVLIALGYLWFFGTRGEEIFSPGPASSEFAFFFGLALVAALATSTVLARLLGAKNSPGEDPPLGS